jgi:Predicted hydrolases of the HAD superfamily
MFGWAGHSVAMGQASADVRAAADEIAAGVDDHGLAPVLERVVTPQACAITSS